MVFKHQNSLRRNTKPYVDTCSQVVEVTLSFKVLYTNGKIWERIMNVIFYNQLTLQATSLRKGSTILKYAGKWNQWSNSVIYFLNRRILEIKITLKKTRVPKVCNGNHNNVPISFFRNKLCKNFSTLQAISGNNAMKLITWISNYFDTSSRSASLAQFLTKRYFRRVVSSLENKKSNNLFVFCYLSSRNHYGINDAFILGFWLIILQFKN